MLSLETVAFLRPWDDLMRVTGLRRRVTPSRTDATILSKTALLALVEFTVLAVVLNSAITLIVTSGERGRLVADGRNEQNDWAAPYRSIRAGLGAVETFPFRAEPVQLGWVAATTATELKGMRSDYPDKSCLLLLGQDGSSFVLWDVHGRSIRLPTSVVSLSGGEKIRAECFESWRH